MDEPTWRALVGGLPDLQALTAKSLRQKAADDQLQKLGITPRLAGALTDLAMLLARAQADPRTQDTPQVIAADLLELVKGTEVNTATVHELVKLVIDDVAPRLRSLSEEKRYVAGVLPTLAAYATTVELRAQLERPFRAGDDPDTYEPSVAKLIPIASIRLRTDDNEIFVFQCDRQMLEFLIARLGATLKELEVLGKSLRGA